MQVLAFPPQEAVWTLREPQFTGQESFTFSGIAHFMKAVSFDTLQTPSSEEAEPGKKQGATKHRLRVVK